MAAVGVSAILVLVWFLWFLPGISAARVLGIRPGKDPLLFLATAFSLAVGVSTLAAWVSVPLGLPAGSFGWVQASLAALAVPAWFLARRRGPALTDDAPDRAALAAGLATLLLLMVLGALVGSSFRITSDSPDHLGTIREILASDRFFPTEAFHLGAEKLGFDPRKGLLHPVYAAMLRASGLDPVTFWRGLPVVTAIVPLLGVYGFGRWIGWTPRMALLAAWIQVLTWWGGPGGAMVSVSAYPNQLGAAAFWIAAGMMVRGVCGPSPTLVAGAVLALFGAVAVHPMFLVFAALFAFLLVTYAALRDRSLFRPLLAAAGGAAALVVPYALYRWTQYAPANPVHTDVQGMLFLGERWFVADPARLAEHIGVLGFAAYPLAVLVTARRLGRSLPGFLAFAASLTVLFLTLNPLVTPFVQSRLTYLVLRLSWLYPPALAAGAVLAALRDGAVRNRGLARALAVLLLVAGIVPGLASLPRWARDAAAREGRNHAARMRPGFDRLDRELPARSVVVTDPVTSFLLPAFTSHKVVSGLDQHSTPNDARGLERMLIARDVLSPLVAPAEAWRLAREAGADAVFLNGALPPGADCSVWTFDRRVTRIRSRQLETSPCFRPVFDDGTVSLFVVAGACEDDARPDSSAVAPFVPTPPGPPVLSSLGWTLHQARVAPSHVRCGTPLRAALLWSADPERAGAVQPTASVRLEAEDLPGADAPGGKIWRLVRELLEGKTTRTRADRVPGGGVVAPDRWPRGLALWDTVLVRPPCSLSPGTYRVTVALNRLAHMPNHHLRDYLYNRDLYAGPEVDTVTVGAH